jgi:hypothetical protein
VGDLRYSNLESLLKKTEKRGLNLGDIFIYYLLLGTLCVWEQFVTPLPPTPTTHTPSSTTTITSFITYYFFTFQAKLRFYASLCRPKYKLVGLFPSPNLLND